MNPGKIDELIEALYSIWNMLGWISCGIFALVGISILSMFIK